MAVFIICFAACTKQEESKEKIVVDSYQKETEKKSYEISSYEMGITMSRVIRICEKDETIFILGEQGKDTVFIQYDQDGNKIEQKLLNIKKETICNMAVDQENKLRIFTSINKKNQRTYYVKTIEENGKITNNCELKQKKNKKDICYPMLAVIAKDGSIYMIAGNKNEQVICFSKDGEEVNRIDCQTILSSIVQIEDSIYVYTGNELKELDIKNGTIQETISLGDFQLLNPRICSGINDNIYFLDNNQFYSFHIKENTMTSLFQWVEEGINGNYIQDYLLMNNGSFFAIYIPIGEEEQEISAVLIKPNDGSNTKKAEKKTLVLACVNSNLGLMKENILEFNQTNENYQIEIKDYGTNSLDPSTELNLDIISGEVPDILCLEMLPANMYIEKGILTDLYPLIESDPEIHADDFIDSVRLAAEKDGKLYYMGAGFQWLDCFAIEKKYQNFVDGWSMEDMEKLYQEMPGDGVFIANMTRQRFITRIVLSQIEDYIEEETGKVNFDSEEFIKLLAFSKNFKDENEESSMQEIAYKEIAEGKLMLYRTSFLELSEISTLKSLYKKAGGYEIISYPSENKKNTLSISFADPAMAISEQCEDKEGAWEFLRQFFTYDYGMKVSQRSCLPVRKDVLEKRLQYAMATEEYIDEDGTIVKPFKGGSAQGDYSVDYDALKEEDIAFVRSLIERIGKIYMDADEIQLNVLDIIKTEAEIYFDGDRTAEETAEIIQNRVQLYINENLS